MKGVLYGDEPQDPIDQVQAPTPKLSLKSPGVGRPRQTCDYQDS